MIRGVLLALALFVASTATSQETPAWDRSAKGKVSFTQAGFYRWHDGGVSSLALSASITGEATHDGHRWRQNHSIHLAYGLVRQNGLALRKSEDVIHVHLGFTNPSNPFFGTLQPSVTVNIRSQFASGFDYKEADSLSGRFPRISGFIAPATIVETAGANYMPFSFASVVFGLAAKQTIVTARPLRARYKVRASRAMRAELGLSGLFSISRDVFKNVHLDHSAQLFAAFNQPGKPDLLSETMVTMTVNQWLQVNLEYVAKLDRDVAKSLQMKELISLGVSFRLL